MRKGDNKTIKLLAGDEDVKRSWSGRFISCVETTDNRGFIVEVYKGGIYVGGGKLWPGRRLNAPVVFDEVRFTEISGSDTSVEVECSALDFEDAEISGTVNIIDTATGRAVALRGEAFKARAEYAALASNYNAFQLWNPGGTGKVLILKNVSFFSQTGAIAAHERVLTSALAVNSVTPHNKKMGGGAAVGQVRQEQRTSFAGSVFGYHSAPNANEENFLDYRDTEIVIPEEAGYSLWCANTGAHLAVNFEWEEEAV